MIALPYAECIEIVIKALTCQVSAAFDADLFGDTYAAPEDNHDQIDRAEALALWGKGLLVWQIGVKVSDIGGDSCSVLFDLLHSDRIAVVPKINSPVRSVKRHGLDFEIFTDSGDIHPRRSGSSAPPAASALRCARPGRVASGGACAKSRRAAPDGACVRAAIAQLSAPYARQERCGQGRAAGA
jgi:hypothetical protein